MKRALIFLAVLIVMLASAMPAPAQDAISVTSSKFTSNFRTNLVYELDAKSSAEINTIAITIQIDGISSSSRFIPDFTAGTQVKAKYEWNLALRYLPPGVSGQYWWNIEDKAGNKKTSDKYNFRVEDSSKQWKKLSNDKFAFYWYLGSDSFGKSLFDSAIAGLNATEQDLNTKVDRQLQIFVYGNRNDFFSAMEPGARVWTGGRAFPEYGITLINIGTSDLDFGLRAVPHELTHLIIYRSLGDLGTSALPQFMNEGLAVYHETVPPSQEDYQNRALQNAIKNDSLLPMRTLVGNFATASDAAYLSYAQSFSMVDFIFKHYGKNKMAQLLDEFKKARHYDDVFKTVLGVDTDGLENEWRKAIGAKPRVVPTRASGAPTARPTFSLSSDNSTPPPTLVQPTAPVVAAAVTPVPPVAPPTPKPAPSNPLTSICGGAFGFIALGLFGMWHAWGKLRNTI